ncbi:MAG: transporter related [Deltaproteobacteria bacterium]|jgi:branched-chain amino acid transport system ATP-binding protein|nr:transporter related [Deltaproteobacteria bacterium]
MLAVNDIHAGYGRVEVLKGISVEVRQGEVVCLLGANGAGKSTLLKVISGLIAPAKGGISFLGHEITKRKPDDIVRAGISHVPEGRQIFATLTVQQNLLLGAYAHGTGKAELGKRYESMFQLFPILKQRFLGKAGSLSGGEQQMLAIARGLMSQPKLLLLDEPSLGLAPIVVNNIFNVIRDLRAHNIPILLVEQNVAAALRIADRAYIIETGKITTQGSAEALLNDDEVRKRYLGM